MVSLWLRSFWGTPVFGVHLPVIRNSNYTLYQKACIVNSLLATKIWYVAQVYPLTMDIATRINIEIYRFIWGSNRDPIERDILYNLKVHGGIGLINIFTTAKSIFLSTTLKMIMDPEKDIIKYYMKGKIDKYIQIWKFTQSCKQKIYTILWIRPK